MGDVWNGKHQETQYMMYVNWLQLERENKVGGSGPRVTNRNKDGQFENFFPCQYENYVI